jgi:fused signal recognition particle receptor
LAGQSLGNKLRALVTKKRNLDDLFFEELEDTLIESDLGARTAMEVVDSLQSAKETRNMDEKELLKHVKQQLLPFTRGIELKPVAGKTSLFLILGVNGVGKTTTIAKMAHFYRKTYGCTPVLAAGDTFRAAAIDQLMVHGKRLDIRVVHQQPGADPGAVIYDALESALIRGEQLVLADTAGRMHNRADLIRELQKIHKIVASRIGEENYQKIVVLDATTGQNALRQVELFHESVGLDAIVLAKYDSAAKGGIVIPVQRSFSVPIAFIGTGESYDDLELFDPETFLDSLLGIE